MPRTPARLKNPGKCAGIRRWSVLLRAKSCNRTFRRRDRHDGRGSPRPAPNGIAGGAGLRSGVRTSFQEWSVPGSNRRPPACKAGRLTRPPRAFSSWLSRSRSSSPAQAVSQIRSDSARFRGVRALEPTCAHFARRVPHRSGLTPESGGDERSDSGFDQIHRLVGVGDHRDVAGGDLYRGWGPSVVMLT